MEGYLVGMDGGGTKTIVRVANCAGQELFCFTGGGINSNGSTDETVKEHLTEILKEIAHRVPPTASCLSLCIGAAGVSNPASVVVLRKTLAEFGILAPTQLVGDFYTALYGALEIPIGAIIIAGTGSICYGRSATGTEHRTGGLGHILGDEGSGYAIGREILTCVAKAADGRGRSTLLTQLLEEQTGLIPSQLVAFVHHSSTCKKEIAALAPILTCACAQKDEVALLLAQKTAVDLLCLLTPVVERLQLEESCCAMCGGVLQKDPFIQKQFLELVGVAYPKLFCTHPRGDAAMGALLIAKQQMKEVSR